jgi:ribosomal protein L11 methyltransferase
MPFLQLTLDVANADPAPYEDALFAAGAQSVTLTDAADNPILEPAPGALPLWPTVVVKALFAHDTDSNVVIAMLQSTLPGQLPAHRFTVVEDRIWEREWLKDFKPMRFGHRLWICPGGMPLPADANANANACIVHLDPGLAFGTGTHQTTALCLQWLDGAELTGKRVIDYGCGSGILAIAALKLGAQSAVGIDLDPQALLASRDNAQRNGVSDRLALQPADADSATTGPADILLANILAGPLEQLAPQLSGLVRPGGRLVLSGILQQQAAPLARCYCAWFEMEPPAIQDDWVRLSGIRKAVGYSL